MFRPEPRVLKYPINFGREQTIPLPKNGEIISCVAHENWPTLYMLVYGPPEMEQRRMFCYGTGETVQHDIPSSTFLGTIIFPPLAPVGRPDVWHLWIENVPLDMSRINRTPLPGTEREPT